MNGYREASASDCMMALHDCVGLKIGLSQIILEIVTENVKKNVMFLLYEKTIIVLLFNSANITSI